MRACDDAVRYANEIYSFHDSDSTTGWVQPAAIPTTTTTVLRRRSVRGAECDRRGTADDADQGGRERGDDDGDDDDGNVIVVLPDAVKFIISVRLRGRSIKAS